MPPKTAAKKLTDVKARRSKMDHELEEAQYKVDQEEAERVCKECKKKEHEE